MLKFARGFILSFESAFSLLFLLYLILLITNHYYIPSNDFSIILNKMHETDLWLVEDSLNYYNIENKNEKIEWLINN
jgi:hypothetical protein